MNNFRHEYYEHRVDKMVSVRIDHDRKLIHEKFADGRKEYLIGEVLSHLMVLSRLHLAYGCVKKVSGARIVKGDRR